MSPLINDNSGLPVSYLSGMEDKPVLYKIDFVDARLPAASMASKAADNRRNVPS